MSLLNVLFPISSLQCPLSYSSPLSIPTPTPYFLNNPLILKTTFASLPYLRTYLIYAGQSNPCYRKGRYTHRRRSNRFQKTSNHPIWLSNSFFSFLIIVQSLFLFPNFTIHTTRYYTYHFISLPSLLPSLLFTLFTLFPSLPSLSRLLARFARSSLTTRSSPTSTTTKSKSSNPPATNSTTTKPSPRTEKSCQNPLRNRRFQYRRQNSRW